MNKQKYNENFKKIIICENINLDGKLKKLNNILDKKVNEEKKFLENLKKFEGLIKEKDINDLPNWGNKKNKFKDIKNFKKIENKENNIIMFNYSNVMVNNLVKNIKFDYSNKINEIRFKTCFYFFLNGIYLSQNINYTYIKYKNIINNKLITMKNKNYFNNNVNNIVLVMDLRTLKTKIVCLNNKKSLLFISNGVIFKKLQLNHKKYKKSEKLTYLIIKSTLVKMGFFKNYKNIFINIKGVKNNNNNFINYINKNIKNKNSLIYIHNYLFSMNKYFKIKKIKAIKKKLKKKIIKYK